MLPKVESTVIDLDLKWEKFWSGSYSLTAGLPDRVVKCWTTIIYSTAQRKWPTSQRDISAIKNYNRSINLYRYFGIDKYRIFITPIFCFIRRTANIHKYKLQVNWWQNSNLRTLSSAWARRSFSSVCSKASSLSRTVSTDCRRCSRRSSSSPWHVASCALGTQSHIGRQTVHIHRVSILHYRQCSQ